MDIKEKYIKGHNGYVTLILIILALVLSLAGSIVFFCFAEKEDGSLNIPMLTFAIALIIIHSLLYILISGLKSVKPNEAYVFTLFGKYYGTIVDSGFYFVNPFVSAVTGTGKKDDKSTIKIEGINIGSRSVSRTVSMKIQTLVNEKQKVNDKLGNPIIIGAIVVWRVKNPTNAVLTVDNYSEFLSSQADSIIRNVARLYPYDDVDDNDGNEEMTLRGSSIEIASMMKNELSESVRNAGLEILEVRINQLAYSSEIAAAMLQKQQAVAIIAARQKIVEGAVSMVEMALEQLSDKEIVNLDEERKAQMVSNLLVILCGNKDAQPIVNSGSIY